jgi:ApbE superfamily uncharacterized protein (UPF0280 family)
MYEERLYRNSFHGANLTFFDVGIFETDLRIGACSGLSDIAREAAGRFRGQIEAFIGQFPEFLASLEPLDSRMEAPEIIMRMLEASR